MNMTLRKSRPGTRGFTLVEMLVVIFIMVILVGLIVGISKLVYNETSKRQTQAWQGIVVSAVEAHYKVKHEWPKEYTLPSPNTPPTGFTGGTARWDAICRCQDLIRQLKWVPQAWDVLSKLPNEAWLDVGLMNADIATPATWPDSTVFKSTFVDSWKQYMDFKMIGGRAVIISPGPDGKMNTGTAADDADNIRSDAQ